MEAIKYNNLHLEVLSVAYRLFLVHSKLMILSLLTLPSWKRKNIISHRATELSTILLLKDWSAIIGKISSRGKTGFTIYKIVLYRYKKFLLLFCLHNLIRSYAILYFHVDNWESLIINIIKHPAYTAVKSGRHQILIQVKFFCIKEIGHRRTG